MKEHYKAQLEALKKPYKIYTDLVEDGAAEQFIDCMSMEGCIQGALMADCHMGYTSPIGGVFLFQNQVVPSITGYDIGCGMSECMLEIKADDISNDQWEAIKIQILEEIPIGFNRHKLMQKMPDNVWKSSDFTSFADEILNSTGAYQLGTLGGGNHFLEIGKTNDGNVSIVIHSGSRGVGHKIATHYMKIAAIENVVDTNKFKLEFDMKQNDWKKTFIDKDNQYAEEQRKKFYIAREKYVNTQIEKATTKIEKPYYLDANSISGQNYINDMNMALEFAIANRKQMIEKCKDAIANVLKFSKQHSERGIVLNELRYINKNHNHAEQYEKNTGLIVHRKGATQAAEGMLGVIPGNMVDGSFVVIGKGSEESMNSSSHGAGRVLSRKKAREQIAVEDFNECTKHLVANHSDKNVDEAPAAYKDIFEVMKNQSDLVEVIDRVIPILNIKG